MQRLSGCSVPDPPPLKDGDPRIQAAHGAARGLCDLLVWVAFLPCFEKVLVLLLRPCFVRATFVVGDGILNDCAGGIRRVVRCRTFAATRRAWRNSCGRTSCGRQRGRGRHRQAQKHPI